MILKGPMRPPWTWTGYSLFFVYLILSFSETCQADLFGSSQPTIRQEVVYYLMNATVVRLDKTIPSFEYSANIKQIPTTPNPPKDGLQGLLYLQNDPCFSQDSSGQSPALLTSSLSSISHVALLPLSNCTIEWKVMRAQNDKAIAAILFKESQEQLNLESLAFSSPVVIPIFVVDPEVGNQLLADLVRPNVISNGNMTGGGWIKKLRVTLYPYEHFFPGIWEFTLIIVVALLILSLATSVAMHCHLYRLRRNQAQRNEATEDTEMTVINKSYLKDLPVHIYDSEQQKIQKQYSHTGPQGTPSSQPSVVPPPRLYLQQDKAIQESVTSATSNITIDSSPVCAICLEEFANGEEIRPLPCQHDYHVTCIDPWLTTKSATCPMCKCRVSPQSTAILHPDRSTGEYQWFSSITSICGPCTGLFN